MMGGQVARAPALASVERMMDDWVALAPALVIARVTLRVARTRSGAATVPLLAIVPCRGCAAGCFSRGWSRVCSAWRRRGRMFQQALAAGAGNLREAVSWTRHAHDARLGGFELGDRPAEEE